MARHRLDIVARNKAGRVQPTAQVFLYEPDTEDEITVYDAATGSVTLDQPLTTDQWGEVPDAWVEPGLYDRRIIFGRSGSSAEVDYTRPYHAISADDVGGVEIAYAQITTTATVVAPGSSPTSSSDVTGLVVTVPPGPRPILIEFFAVYMQSSAANRNVNAWLYDSAADKNFLITSRFVVTEVKNEAWRGTLRRPAPSIATTYQLRTTISSAGNVLLAAGPASADLDSAPAYLSVVGR